MKYRYFLEAARINNCLFGLPYSKLISKLDEIMLTTSIMDIIAVQVDKASIIG